jgi:FkbM family methyltransferase
MDTGSQAIGIEEISTRASVTDLFARPIEKIKWLHRAEKYKQKEDSGGIAYIQQHVKKGDTVFDIGAHKGGYLYFFLEQLSESGRVYAFEPQSLLYKYLLKLQHLFSWENVVIESAAVSHLQGKAMLCVPHNNGRHSSPCATIIENHFFQDYQFSEEVNTISLDNYCFEQGIVPDFLKVDVEGNELSVFMGAESILRSYKPKILFECEARFIGKQNVLKTFDFLLDIGYRGYFIMGSTIHPIAEFDLEKHQDMEAPVYCNNFIFE